MTTILDLIGSSIIGGLLLLTMMRMNMVAVDNQSFFTEDLAVQENLRNAVKIIENDLRKIGYGSQIDLNGNYPLMYILTIADSNKIKYWCGTDPNIPNAYDTISYTLSDSDRTTPNPYDLILTRRIVTSTGAVHSYKICLGVTQFHLDYFGLGGNQLTTPLTPNAKAQVQIIQVSLRIMSPYLTSSQFESDSVGYLKRSALWRESQLVARNLTR
jgi:hypothetical protein